MSSIGNFACAVALSTIALISTSVSALPVEAKVNDSADISKPINWTPVLMSPTASPQVFRGSDNALNLVYEVILNNAFGAPSNIVSFEVLDESTGKVVLKLAGKDLEAVLSQVSKGKSTQLSAGTMAVVWVNLTFQSPVEVPSKLTHKLTVTSKDLGNPKGAPIQYINEGAALEVNKEPALVISPPLRGGKWVAMGGYCGKMGHRRALFGIDNKMYSAQRYAIDWLRIGDDGYSTGGDKKKCESSRCYDQPIHAVADGTVYGVVDRFKEQVPFNPTGTDRYHFPAGNSITLDLGNSRYAMYAHLKPGTIKVKAGDKVRRGDVIAHVGNAGNSTGPHLHMHITDSPQILGANGVPYVFDTVELLGSIDIDAFAKNDDEAKKQTIAPLKDAGVKLDVLCKEGHIFKF